MSALRGCGDDEKLDHIALTAPLSSTGSASRAYNARTLISTQYTVISEAVDRNRSSARSVRNKRHVP